MSGNQSSDWKLDAHFGGDAPWTASRDDILARMSADGGWFRFSEYDNVRAVLDLEAEGKIEFDPDWNNRVSGMVTSLRVKVVDDDREAPGE